MLSRQVASYKDYCELTGEEMNWKLTGEIRCPLQGEWFQDNRGHPQQARFDFSEQKFPILTQEPTDPDTPPVGKDGTA